MALTPYTKSMYDSSNKKCYLKFVDNSLQDHMLQHLYVADYELKFYYRIGLFHN